MTDPNHMLTDAGSTWLRQTQMGIEPVDLGQLQPLSFTASSIHDGTTQQDLPFTGVKYDAGKPRMDLMDPYAIEELSKVLTFGAAKYKEHNWRKGIAVGRLIASAMRHLFSLLKGEDVDPETGLSHAAHAMCCCMFLVWTIKHKPEMDDRV